MLELIEANWVVFALALFIGLVVAWWVFARGSTVAAPRDRKPDVLDEGAAPVQRNQALIDAASASDITPPARAGIGEVIAVAEQDEVEEAQALATMEAAAAPATDAEAGDDLSKIKGLGPKLVTLLKTLGVVSYDQIAAWDGAEIDRIDAGLGTFAGRIRRDNWVEQAKLLSSEDKSAYEAKFGKL